MQGSQSPTLNLSSEGCTVKLIMGHLTGQKIAWKCHIPFRGCNAIHRLHLRLLQQRVCEDQGIQDEDQGLLVSAYTCYCQIHINSTSRMTREFERMYLSIPYHIYTPEPFVRMHRTGMKSRVRA